MNPLSVLADALLFLGKSIDPYSVTKVRFEFEHSPSDIGLSRWLFKVTLVGTKEIDDSGAPAPCFTLTWEGVGETEEGAVLASFKPVQDHIRCFLSLREQEVGFAQQALLVLTGTGGLPVGLWSEQDPAPVSDAAPVQADVGVLEQMFEESASLNGSGT